MREASGGAHAARATEAAIAVDNGADAPQSRNPAEAGSLVVIE
jgi:hypothetical protein